MTISKKNAPRAAGKANARIAKGSLFDAVERLDLAEVERLLAAGVSPNERWPEKYRGTALHTACCGNCEASLAIVKALLAAGADIDAIERHNHETPLHFAVDADGSDDWRIVRHLLRSKAKVNLCDRDGLNPAELASCLEHSASAVIAMLDEGMPVETRSSVGTLLWYCSYDSYAPHAWRALPVNSLRVLSSGNFVCTRCFLSQAYTPIVSLNTPMMKRHWGVNSRCVFSPLLTWAEMTFQPGQRFGMPCPFTRVGTRNFPQVPAP